MSQQSEAPRPRDLSANSIKASEVGAAPANPDRFTTMELSLNSITASEVEAAPVEPDKFTTLNIH